MRTERKKHTASWKKCWEYAREQHRQKQEDIFFRRLQRQRSRLFGEAASIRLFNQDIERMYGAEYWTCMPIMCDNKYENRWIFETTKNNAFDARISELQAAFPDFDPVPETKKHKIPPPTSTWSEAQNTASDIDLAGNHVFYETWSTSSDVDTA